MIMSKNVNELREEMRAEFERNMSSLMDYCIEQQQDEEVIGEQILEKEQEMNRMLDLYNICFLFLTFTFREDTRFSNVCQTLKAC